MQREFGLAMTQIHYKISVNLSRLLKKVRSVKKLS